MKKIFAALILICAVFLFYILKEEESLPPIIEDTPKITTIKKVVRKPLPKETTQTRKTVKKVVKKEKYSKEEKENYYEELERLTMAQHKELELCEQDFDDYFSEFLPNDRENGLRIYDLKKKITKSNLQKILHRIKEFNPATPTSSKIITILANPIALEASGKRILEIVGHEETCGPLKIGALFNDLLRTAYNSKGEKKTKEKIALGVLDLIEKKSSVLTYTIYLGWNNSNLQAILNIVLGKGKRLSKKMDNLEKVYKKIAQQENDSYVKEEKKLGFNTFYPKSQILSYKNAKMFQKMQLSLIQEMKKEITKQAESHLQH